MNTIKNLHSFSFIFFFCLFLIAFLPAGAQDIILRRGSATESIEASPTVPASAETALPNAELTATAVPDPELIHGYEDDMIQLRNRGYDPSVKLDNAKETFDTGDDVPKPQLDRPITSAHDDLKMDYACQAVLNAPHYFQQLHFGEDFTLDVTFINTGTQAWDLNIDVMQYTGDLLERDEKYYYDIDKDVQAPDGGGTQGRIIYPGESIRFTLPMKAPAEAYHEDNKYYSAYTLVKNWNLYGDSELHSGRWERDYRDGRGGMFCPIYFYIYVPD